MYFRLSDKFVQLVSMALARLRPGRAHLVRSLATKVPALSCVPLVLPHSVAQAEAEEGGVGRRAGFRARVEAGPELGDFIAGEAGQEAGYEGSLVLGPGEKRLRLPPWLKTEIPVGKNFSQLKVR